MFCYNCGNEILGAAKFCINCGSKIEQISTVIEDMKVDRSNEYISFEVFGKKLTYHNSVQMYGDVKDIFMKLASESREHIKGLLRTEINSLDKFVKNGNRIYDREINNVIDVIIDELQDIGIYYIGRKEIEDLMEGYIGNWDSIYSQVTESYQKIVGKQQAIETYRRIKKSERMKFVGGGFGLSGAMKGIAMAGSLNMCTGVLYSIGNTFGSIRTSSEIEREKQRVFSNRVVQKSILDSIYSDILNLHYLIIDIVNNNTDIVIKKYTSKDKEKADNIYNNIKDNNVKTEHLEDNIVKMLELYPFEESYYKIAIEKNPFKYKSLVEIGEFFGIQVQKIYERYKINIQHLIDMLGNYAWISLEYEDAPQFTQLISMLTCDIEQNIIYIKEFFNQYTESEYIFNSIALGKDIKNNKLNNAKNAYATLGEEIPILLYDGTVWGSAKNGLLITNKRIYGNNRLQVLCKDISQQLCGVEYYNDKNTDVSYLKIDDEFSIYISNYEGQANIYTDLIDIVILIINITNMIQCEDSKLISVLDKLRGLFEESDQEEWEWIDIINNKETVNNKKIANDRRLKEYECINCNTEFEAYDDIVKMKCPNCGISLILSPQEEDNLEGLINEFDEKYLAQSKYKKYIFSSYQLTTGNKIRFETAINTYVDLENKEIPLICYDDSLTGSGKEGFVITDKAIYYKNTRNTGKIRLTDIIDVKGVEKLISPSICINEKIILPLSMSGKWAVKEISNSILDLINVLRKL